MIGLLLQHELVLKFIGAVAVGLTYLFGLSFTQNEQLSQRDYLWSDYLPLHDHS